MTLDQFLVALKATPRDWYQKESPEDTALDERMGAK